MYNKSPIPERPNRLKPQKQVKGLQKHEGFISKHIFLYILIIKLIQFKGEEEGNWESPSRREAAILERLHAVLRGQGQSHYTKDAKEELQWVPS